MPIARLSGLPGNTFFRLGAPPYLATNIAVPVGVQFPLWPEIESQAIIVAGDLAAPQYLWYRSDVDPALVTTGETAFFARETTFSFTVLGVTVTATMNLSIAADNAFQSRVSIIPSLGLPVTFTFTDGNTSPLTNEVNPPFNWQNIYTFPVEFSLAAGVTSFTVEFEAKVVNYAQTLPGANQQTNPAGFMYTMDFTNFVTTPTVTEVVPPSPTTPLV
ncbi:MAG: hypothetical protein VR68_07550 [Peptococcaceae bacterium BRH_c4a]|nr:MAG: hypothetical protein VR68_07550 [Peptococcaceae bacterium BRH_c4a]